MQPAVKSSPVLDSATATRVVRGAASVGALAVKIFPAVGSRSQVGYIGAGLGVGCGMLLPSCHGGELRYITETSFPNMACAPRRERERGEAARSGNTGGTRQLPSSPPRADAR